MPEEIYEISAKRKQPKIDPITGAIIVPKETVAPPQPPKVDEPLDSAEPIEEDR